MSMKKVFKMILAALLIMAGIFLCINSYYAWRYSTDVNFGIITAVLISLGCFIYSFRLAFFNEPLIGNEAIRLIVTIVVIASVVFFMIVEALIIMAPITHRAELAGKVDHVIVLGCGIWPDGRPTLSLASRLDKAISYYEENTHVNIIVSGGQGPNEPFPEAVAMKEYLIKRGVPEEKIIVEDKSTSTRENFEYTRRLIDPSFEKSIKVIFVTNDFHVLRSKILAKRFGFEAYAISAPTPSVILVNSYLREFFAFIKSMLIDY